MRYLIAFMFLFSQAKQQTATEQLQSLKYRPLTVIYNYCNKNFDSETQMAVADSRDSTIFLNHTPDLMDLIKKYHANDTIR